MSAEPFAAEAMNLAEQPIAAAKVDQPVEILA
jgi:hypothetical protein